MARVASQVAEKKQARVQELEAALREALAALDDDGILWIEAAKILRRALGEKKRRVLINTRTGETREWEPGLVLQAEGPLEWELREE